ncbi:hypothetical protein GCM10027160_06240 [Streptomyces calidiresistens]|uniref:Uncharacterized protein n=1 Tax=Streptomyces calidiresistens TaxID=1485586 RepID=A0A7W3T5E8_9ACTN|nr:hypothetical protein [Streptomyces calidiresistens]
MIELLRVVFAALAEALPNVPRLRREKRRRELAADLFLLYVALNRVVLLAEEIVDDLEARVRYPPGDPRARFGPAASHRVRRQAEQLARVRTLLLEHSAVFQILHAEAYNRMVLLLGVKMSALDVLLFIMRTGTLPTEPSGGEVRRILDAGLPDPGVDFDEVAHRMELAWRHSGIALGSAPDADTRERIAAYLEESRPRERVAGMRRVLADFRAVLEENFSVGDVLLDVGDRRINLL